jgi:hypothetical protein
LLKTEEFRTQAHLTRGYVQVLRECLSASAAGDARPGMQNSNTPDSQQTVEAQNRRLAG